MKKLMIMIALLTITVFIVGCNNNNPQNTNIEPKMDMVLDQGYITVSSGSTGNTKLTLTKKDSESASASFSIQLISPEEENVYFVGDNGDKITSINTTLFENKDDRKVYPLNIKAKKDSTKDEVVYTLDIKLLYNEKELGNPQKLKVRII